MSPRDPTQTALYPLRFEPIYQYRPGAAGAAPTSWPRRCRATDQSARRGC
jgi:hypothetical protein